MAAGRAGTICTGYATSSAWGQTVVIQLGSNKSVATLKAPQWYQHNLSVLAKASLRSEEKTRQGARSSRFSRWIEQGEILRQKLAVDWEQPMSLEKLSLVKPILCSMMFNVFSNIYFAFFC